jgi:hypothetical protein
MPTPAPQPTRQQLDDLDALLQRMLALPVNPTDDMAAALAAPHDDQLTPPDGNMIVSDPGPPPAPPSAPRSIWLPPSPPKPIPLPLLNPVPAAERRPPVLPPPDRPMSPLAALAASRPPSPPLLLRPVLWLNRQFDSLALGFGAPGRWLRRPAGRTLLGLIGLALLAAAAALVLIDRIGWTW